MDKESIVTEFNKFLVPVEIYLADIMNIVQQIGEPLEGNSFYHHQTLNRYSELLNKQINLYWAGKEATKKVCEIGFNAGHSALLFLLGKENMPLDFTIFDIGVHKYTKPALDYLKSQFTKVNFEYVEGNSIQLMPKWIENNLEKIGTYDLVHVDGGHSEECIVNDMKNSTQLVRVGGLLIIDDTNVSYISAEVDKYIQSGNFVEMDILQTTGYEHRMLKRLR